MVIGNIKKIIDVAKWNVITDYNVVKSSGIEYAIVKAINKQNKKEEAFEQHYQGMMAAGINVIGTYHYSYANTVEKAKEAVQAWLKAVNGRCNIFFLDWEDACLPKDSKAIEIINTYAEAIHRAGHEFALYCSLSWYNLYLKKYKLPYELWIARYYAGYKCFSIADSVNDKYKPNIDNLIGWQYTSSGQINGIAGRVDINLWYEYIQDRDNASIPVEYNPYTEPTQNVTIGSLGNDANWVLWYLWRFGMLLDTDNMPDARMIDGIVDAGALEKIKKAQYILGLNPDGIVGPMTKSIWKKIC